MRTLEVLALSLISVFAPIQAVILTVFALVVGDLITGIAAARARGEPIVSSKMKRTVAKLFLYELALLLAFATEKYLISDMLPVSKLVSSIIGITELKSVLENLDTINGESIFTSLVKKLASPKE
jgi:hypothetical protein